MTLNGDSWGVNEKKKFAVIFDSAFLRYIEWLKDRFGKILNLIMKVN